MWNGQANLSCSQRKGCSWPKLSLVCCCMLVLCLITHYFRLEVRYFQVWFHLCHELQMGRLFFWWFLSWGLSKLLPVLGSILSSKISRSWDRSWTGKAVCLHTNQKEFNLIAAWLNLIRSMISIRSGLLPPYLIAQRWPWYRTCCL